MPFITPVIDRLQSDVIYAMVNQHLVADLKGALNISDVNRIIDNTIYLRDLLIQYGFVNTFPSQSHFTQSDIPHIHSKIDVIRDNINALCDSFYKLDNPTITYGDTLNYEDVNTLEINLKITNDLIESLIAELLYCGACTCGVDINL